MLDKKTLDNFKTIVDAMATEPDWLGFFLGCLENKMEEDTICNNDPYFIELRNSMICQIDKIYSKELLEINE